MKLPFYCLVPLALCAALPAQQPPTVTTSTDYAVLADGTFASDFDSEAVGTPVAQELRVSAHTGADCDEAYASTHVTRGCSTCCGERIEVHEQGGVLSTHSNGNLRAGTSDGAPGARTPSLDAHGLRIAYALAPATAGIVRVRLSGDVPSGGVGEVTLDVDEDGNPEFSAQANGQVQELSIPVTAGLNGLNLDLVTRARVALQGPGQKDYDFTVSVVFCMGPGTLSCAFTPFGAECGFHLEGSMCQPCGGGGVQLLGTGGHPFARGAIFIADALPRPMPLPYGNCDLLLDPLGIIGHIQLDMNGELHLCIPVQLHTVVISLQILTLESRYGQLVIETSNGVELACR